MERDFVKVTFRVEHEKVEVESLALEKYLPRAFMVLECEKLKPF